MDKKQQDGGGAVVPKAVEREMQTAYLDYAMSVIVGRALPDVRDGLKPVHRRILYAMYELSNTHDKPFKKSARIVGEVLGKYHPHGDAAIYDAMVRMAQDFSMRYPLIEGQGNFGSIDGDNPAAMRYTEARLTKFAEEMLEDIDKETVDFALNFDATLKEPTVLPCKIPNLLVNGSSGIAVGMATNMPPHNLAEIVDALVAIIDKPQTTKEELLAIVKGPDFPTGGFIIGKRGLMEAYLTGKGIIRIRGKAEIVEQKDKRQAIIISQLPYQVNKAELVKTIAELARNKKIEGIAEIADRSDREGMHIFIELKKDANAQVVLNQLYAHTQLESAFGINNVALVNGEPKTLGLEQLLRLFLEHRVNIVKRRSLFELKVAKERKHIVEGLILAVEKIEEVVQIVKTAKEPLKQLVSRFSLTEKQAEAILEMKIRKLSALESGKLKEENEELARKIEYLQKVLSDERLIYQIIKDELIGVKQRYGDERKTQVIEAEEEDVEIEDLIADEEVAVIITQDGYIKRVPIMEYKAQRRGGKGIIGSETKEDDQVKDVILASTHDYLLFFTDKGIVHWLKAYKIPSGTRYSMGKAIVNLLQLEGEKVCAWVKTKDFSPEEYLIMVTKNGIIKRTQMTEYCRPRKGGIIAITLKEGDMLIDAKKTDGKREVILATSEGMAIRFPEKQIREIGRTGQGVIGIRLKKGDCVVGMAVDDAPTLLTVTENGYGKRTLLSDYRLQARGGQGVKNIKTAGRNGKVVGILSVSDEDEILVVSSGGKIIRMPAKEISIIGRNTSGVRLMKLEENEKVVAIERVNAS
ncbi:MAG: DNA gyrase subunit A [Candidatus Micrarchaeota archaeon]|nr:DNA gyrase subunit A [Candidatus Micrarchaeota archaeon]